jgi:hypothetical protein
LDANFFIPPIGLSYVLQLIRDNLHCLLDLTDFHRGVVGQVGYILHQRVEFALGALD